MKLYKELACTTPIVSRVGAATRLRASTMNRTLLSVLLLLPDLVRRRANETISFRSFHPDFPRKIFARDMSPFFDRSLPIGVDASAFFHRTKERSMPIPAADDFSFRPFLSSPTEMIRRTLILLLRQHAVSDRARSREKLRNRRETIVARRVAGLSRDKGGASDEPVVEIHIVTKICLRNTARRFVVREYSVSPAWIRGTSSFSIERYFITNCKPGMGSYRGLPPGANRIGNPRSCEIEIEDDSRLAELRYRETLQRGTLGNRSGPKSFAFITS